MDPTTGGANAMRLARDYEPPTRARRDGADARGYTSDEMPAGRMDGGAGGAEGPETGAMGTAATGEMPRGEMPRGEMQTDTPEARDRLVGTMEAGTGANEMPSAGMPSAGLPADGSSTSGTMPTGSAAMGSMPAGAMTGGTGAAIGAGPGPDGMPAGAMREQQDGAKPGETTPNRATLDGVVSGLTIRGEWRLTLSSVSTGSGG